MRLAAPNRYWCDGFNLYLVGGEHCLSLTNSFDNAKGVVVADVNDDE